MTCRLPLLNTYNYRERHNYNYYIIRIQQMHVGCCCLHMLPVDVRNISMQTGGIGGSIYVIMHTPVYIHC